LTENLGSKLKESLQHLHKALQPKHAFRKSSKKDDINDLLKKKLEDDLKKKKEEEKKKKEEEKKKKEEEEKKKKEEKKENKKAKNEKKLDDLLQPKKMKPIAPDSPIKKFNNKHEDHKPVKLYVPTISSITTTYTPIETYFKFIYYTQPIGYLIFYDDAAMVSYKTCEYVAGVATCEKRIVLPPSFTILAHQVYYGLNFDQCSA